MKNIMATVARQPGEHGRQARTNTTSHSNTAHICHGCIAHARCVDGSVITMGSVHVVCCTPGICLSCVITAHESLREKTENILPIRTYTIRPLELKSEKSSCPLPPGKKTFERPPRAPECTDRARTLTSVSGRASRVDYMAFCPKAHVRRDMFEKKRKFHNSQL